MQLKRQIPDFVIDRLPQRLAAIFGDEFKALILYGSWDEGNYWETRDRRLLAEKPIRLGHYIRRVEKVINGIDVSGEGVRDPETLASRIEQALHKTDEEHLFD